MVNTKANKHPATKQPTANIKELYILKPIAFVPPPSAQEITKGKKSSTNLHNAPTDAKPQHDKWGKNYIDDFFPP